MLKRKRGLILVLSTMLLAGCCDTNDSAHKYGAKYGYDDTNHWKVCLDEGCDNIKESSKEAHDMGEWTVTTKATSTKEGVETRKCKTCAFSETRSYSAVYGANNNNHWLENSETGVIDESTKEAHTFVSYEGDARHAVTEATCTSEGVGYEKCSSCGFIRSVKIEKTEHSFGNWSVKTPTSSTTDGIESRKCSVCEKEETRTLKYEHTHTFDTTNWEKNADGHWHKATCEHTTEKGNFAAHSYGSWQTTLAPTETQSGSKKRVCGTCGYEDVATINPIQAPSNSFVITTDLDAVKEIHTSQQKTYLSYTGNYATMPSNQYPDGQSHLSDSLPVDLAWTFTVPSGKTLKNYSVTFGQEDDLSDGYEKVGTTTGSIKLYNTFLGTNYFRINANYTDGTKDISAIKTFKVSDVAPRNLAIEGMTNCRDMGGRATVAGGKVRQGLLYRTSGKGQNGSINDNTREVMLKQMGVKTEINVSDSTSYNVSLTGTTVLDAKMDYGGSARHHFSRNAESLKNVLSILSDENNYPVYFHCRIGTDRTGLVANVVSGLLGVELNSIYQDYLFSNFGKIGEKRYIGTQAGQDNIENYMNEINAMPGANFQEKVYNTMLSIGVEKATLDKVINILTEGNVSNNDQGQIVANANNFTLTGTSLTNTPRSKITDRNEPVYYAKMTSNASASYTFKTTNSGDATIYGYLGHNDYSTSKTIANSLKVEVDGKEVTVPSTTFAEAGMGNCSNRTNYYFVKLGELSNLSAGDHAITVTGKSNDMKLATLSVMGISGEVTSTGNGGQEIPPVEDNSITLNIADATGWHDPNTKWSTSSSSQTATWNINGVLEAGSYKVSIVCKMTSESHGSRYFYNQYETDKGSNPDTSSQDPYRYWLEIGNEKFYPTNTKSWSDNGMSKSSFTTVEYISNMTIPTGAASITMVHGNIGYSLIIQSVKFEKIA